MYNKKRICLLLSEIEKFGLDAFIIPSNDEFNSEFVVEQNNHLLWLSGFKCSNGVLIISNSFSIFSTDKRYLEQAKNYFPAEVTVLDVSTKSYQEGLSVFNGMKLGYNPMLHTISSLQYYKKLCEKHNIKLISVESDIVRRVRDPEEAKVIDYDCYSINCDISPELKINAVLKKIESYADFLFTNQSDEICWLLNIRGNASKFTPIIFAYLFLSKDGVCHLFTDACFKENIESKYLKINKISELENFLPLISREKIQIDPKYTPCYFLDKFENLIQESSPIESLKAIKSQYEIENIKKAHIIDGAAISKLIYWLYKSEEPTEISTVEQLFKIRSSFKEFVSDSFATISAFGKNSSMIHYASDGDNKITTDGLYLLDAGGQYLYGTTDMTRTMCIGVPTEEHKKMFTLVLKGHIRLANAVFPKGTCGLHLDALARLDLWRELVDYGHGTGHGVGYFLSVHEGPQAISMRNDIKLEAGMVLSNEPGFYKEGEYGIRIENLMYVQEVDENFMNFEILTLVPIISTLIDYKLLTKEEIMWILRYNNLVLEKIGFLLSKEELEFFRKMS